MREDVIQRLAERIAPSDPVPTARVLNASPELQGDLGWLEDVLDAVEDLPVVPVPSSVSASLHNIMAAESSSSDPAPTPRIELAIPIHDSRTAGVLVGVRGEHSGTGWTVMYTAATADVILDGEASGARDPGSSTDISGQILIRNGTAQAFHVSAQGPVEATATTDRLGQFFLGQLQAGHYEFEARCPEFALRWSSDIVVDA